MKDVLILALLFALLPSGVFASVVINEIAWMGSEVDGIEPKNWWRYEWFELYNNSNSPVSLGGWKIELYRADLDWSLELNGAVPARGYFLVVASDKISSDYDLNYSNLGGKFINGGQKVLLKDGSGKVVDVVDASSGWPAGDNDTKQTMERADSGWKTSQNPGGTPRAPNSSGADAPTGNSPPATGNETEDSVNEDDDVPATTEDSQPATDNPTTDNPVSYPDGILINELLPSPEGPDAEEEWIEIFNQNDFAVELSGWKLQDTTGSVKTYTFPESTSIGANGFLVLSRPTTNITLNNSGDGVRLSKPNGDIADEVVFSKSPTGQSYNRPSVQLRTSPSTEFTPSAVEGLGTSPQDEWAWSEVLTPGSENIVPANPTPDKSTGEEKSVNESGYAAAEKKAGEQVSPQDRVLAETGSGVKPLLPFLLPLLLAISAGVLMLILKRKLSA